MHFRLASPLPPFAIAAMILTIATLRPASCLTTTLIRRKPVARHARNGASLAFDRRSHRVAIPVARTSARISTRLHSATSDDRGAVRTDDRSPSPWYSPSLMDHMLYRIKGVNNVPYDVQRSLIDFTLGGHVLGKVMPKVAERLISAGPSTFELSRGTNQPTLTLSNAAGITVEQRTRSVAKVMESLRDSGYVTGWRDELYPVAESFDSPPAFLIERAAASLLGALEYGVHVNGLVGDGEGGTRMWMARRSPTKSKFPGFLDHVVAGGQPYGLSLMDNVVKECAEEAGIPPEITRQGIQPAGAISYECYGGRRKREGEGVVSRAVLFCFDLRLPDDFVPAAADGEVECFFTWGPEDIAASMDPEYDDPIKPNCYPVIIDYLLRSGAISPDSPKYLEVLRTLRSGTCG